MASKNRHHDRGQARGTVLVLGATGKQGGATVAALKAKGWVVRALVRNPDSNAAKVLASAGTTLFRGDFRDSASMRTAMSGAHGVFSMQPNSGSAASGVTNADELLFGKAVADIAVESGVQHLVYTSAGIISKGKTGVENLDVKIEIEEHIRRSDIASTIVRPSTFMDLLVLPGMGLNRGTFSFFVRPEQSFQVIAVQDIGRIVATIFCDRDRFAGQTMAISGDEVTGLDIQAALSEAAGRSILYQRFPDALLTSNASLGRAAELFDDGRGSGLADIAEIKRQFGDILTFKEWLVGPGRALLQVALLAENQPIALR